jgi:hypothetical protein
VQCKCLLMTQSGHRTSLTVAPQYAMLWLAVVPGTFEGDGRMYRRDFIKVIAGSAAAWPIASHAQQTTRMPRIGVLLPGTPASFALRTKTLLDEPHRARLDERD